MYRLYGAYLEACSAARYRRMYRLYGAYLEAVPLPGTAGCTACMGHTWRLFHCQVPRDVPPVWGILEGCSAARYRGIYSLYGAYLEAVPLPGTAGCTACMGHTWRLFRCQVPRDVLPVWGILGGCSAARYCGMYRLYGAYLEAVPLPGTAGCTACMGHTWRLFRCQVLRDVPPVWGILGGCSAARYRGMYRLYGAYLEACSAARYRGIYRLYGAYLEACSAARYRGMYRLYGAYLEACSAARYRGMYRL